MDTCPICGESVPDGTEQCPKCDTPLSSDESALDKTSWAGHNFSSIVESLNAAGKRPPVPQCHIGGFEKFCINVAMVMSVLGYGIYVVMGVMFFRMSGFLWGLASLLGLFVTIAQLIVYRTVLSFYKMQADSKRET